MHHAVGAKPKTHRREKVKKVKTPDQERGMKWNDQREWNGIKEFAGVGTVKELEVWL